MNSTFFSVVIPTHNRSALLKRAVEGVLKQEYKDFEILIVDDHSDDDTAGVAKSFSDKRVRYLLNNRTKGACGARNTGIFNANGSWVAFLDDDDYWLPKKLKYQYELIEKSKESVGLICTDYAIVNGGDSKPVIIRNRPFGWVQDKILSGGMIGCLSSTCIRNDILRKIDGFDEAFPSCQDQDLWVRVADVSEFRFVPKIAVIMFQEKRERIGQNYNSKLDGYIVMRNKHAWRLKYNFRVRYRFESRIMIYSILLKNINQIVIAVPWFLLGIIIDPIDFLKSIKTTFTLIVQQKTLA